MQVRGLIVWLMGWLCAAVAVPSSAAGEPAPVELLLQDTVRLQALPQSPVITSHLQLLHALIEIDLGMTETASARLPRIQGSLSVAESVEQLRLLLALRYWQHGETARAQQLLAHLEQPFSGALERERVLLQALQRLAAGERGAAVMLFNRLRSTSTFLSVDSLDLALTLLQVGESEYALDLLQLLGNSAAEDEPAERLRERANLVLARELLRRGQSDAAQLVLERVRLEGPDGSAALLLLGWVKLELAGAEAALVPWLDLSLRDENDPAVLEGRLALPMALFRRTPDQQALDHFTLAIEGYQQRLLTLDAAIAELDATQDEARWLAQGAALRQGGSARAAALLERRDALLAMAGRWPEPDGSPFDAEPLREALLMRLRQVDSTLANDSRQAVWREMYSRLGRYLAADFESERVTSGKRPLAGAPFQEERQALGEAAAQLLPLYRSELLAALQQQRRRVAGYLDQAQFMVAKLHELAMLQQLEGE